MRGQKQAADSQISKTAGNADQFLSNATSELGPLSEQASSLMSNGGLNLSQIKGFDPATANAVSSSTMGPAAAAFGGAEHAIQRNAAITGNNASTPGALTDLALKKGSVMGDLGNKVAMENTDFKLQNADYQAKQRQSGIDLLSGLYGTNIGAGVGLRGQVPGLLGGRAAGGGWSQGFSDVLKGLQGAGNDKNTL